MRSAGTLALLLILLCLASSSLGCINCAMSLPPSPIPFFATSTPPPAPAHPPYSSNDAPMPPLSAAKLGSPIPFFATSPTPPPPDPPPYPSNDAPPPRLTAAKLGLKFYKGVISPLLPPACRFLPTCSVYGQMSIDEFGLSKGAVLTAWRLARCTPLGGLGYDPPVWPPVKYTFGSY